MVKMSKKTELNSKGVFTSETQKVNLTKVLEKGSLLYRYQGKAETPLPQTFTIVNLTFSISEVKPSFQFSSGFERGQDG